MLMNVMFIRKTCTSYCFVALHRLSTVVTTAVDCAHELKKEESGIKGKAGKILQN